MDDPNENIKIANIKEKTITHSMLSNVQDNYNSLKEKLSDLEKNNEAMKKLYKSEAERLTKENNLIFSKTDEGRIPFLENIENQIINLRKDNEKLESLINEKKLFFQFLSSHQNENLKNSCLNSDGQENNLENDENIRALIDEQKINFENKISQKLKELKDYYFEKNGIKIEEPIPILQKPLSLFQSSEKKPETITNFEIHSIHYNTGLSETDIQLINNLIAVQCLKEEYPKEFFIDYIFNEIELTNSNEEYKLKDSLELKRIKQDKPYHNSMAVTDSFIAQNIAKIFDINSTEDINMLSKYLNTISKKNPAELKNALNQNLTGFRYRQYETEEKFKYEEELREIFKNKKNEIKLKGNGDIIHIAEMNYFLKMNNVVMKSDLYYYMIQLMKVSKKDKLLNPKMTNSLHLYELYLPNLINIL